MQIKSGHIDYICKLARIMNHQHERTSAYCSSNGYPNPSFDPQAPSITIPPTAPLHVLVARETILSSALKIKQLVVEPSDYLRYQAVQFQNFACVYWLCHFRILSFIPLHGSVPYSELATVASVPEMQLKSIARMAMLSNFLVEPIPGEIAHNATSTLLVTNPGLLDWALYLAEVSVPSASRIAEATERWGATEKKNETPFNIVRDTDMPFLDYVGKSPELSEQYAAHVKHTSLDEGTIVKHLSSGFDWGSLGEATIVDICRGPPNLLAITALATIHPKLKFVLQKPAAVAAEIQTHISSLPEAIKARISSQDYAVPIAESLRKADIYLLRRTLHGLTASAAAAVLEPLLLVLKGNSKARILILDSVLPIPGSVLRHEEALMRSSDLMALEIFNAKEREVEDWKQLIEGVNDVDGRLVIRKIGKGTGCILSVLEVGYHARNPH
ncbi:hypothetical protein B7494_g7015 [Chlorociboria aeruginascens]|nr:hypothetical protein B7494_g7015 [Chlorociboria aeruginascens]